MISLASIVICLFAVHCICSSSAYELWLNSGNRIFVKATSFVNVVVLARENLHKSSLDWIGWKLHGTMHL